MKARSNLLHFASNKADKSKVKPKHSSQPQSLNDVNFSPQSNSKRDSYIPACSSSPNLDDNTGSDKENIAGLENKSNRSKALPKINNPKAENRLKALMDLLGKKNPALPTHKISSAKVRVSKDDPEMSFKIKKNPKNNIFLPPLTPKNLEQNNSLEEMKKNFAEAPVIKVTCEEETKLTSKKSDPLSSQLHRKKMYRDYSVPIGNKKKITFKPFNKNFNGDDKVTSPTPHAEELLKVNKKLFKVPEPNLSFDTRIHRISIDDALERLNQLTNQSGNARKDLLRIQENALAIRLSYERNHKSLERIPTQRNP